MGWLAFTQGSQTRPSLGPRALAAAVLSMAVVAPARAQAPPPAYIAWIDGSATLERDGVEETATANAPFVSGDRLRTTRGRADILFPDGTALDVDESSEIDLVSPSLLRLIRYRPRSGPVRPPNRAESRSALKGLFLRPKVPIWHPARVVNSHWGCVALPRCILKPARQSRDRQPQAGCI